MKENANDVAVYKRLAAMVKANPRYEFVFREVRTRRSPEWGTPLKDTLTTLSDGTLAYVFDAWVKTKQFTPEMNRNNKVFVFGSNLAGRHGAGAANEAFHHWGAEMGKGSGRQGNSYGIPTKDAHLRTLRLSEIKPFVDEFKAYAQQHPRLLFLVTEVGCGLAGYTPAEMAPLFQGCPANCVLPESFS